jgi:hypothetical protein
VARATRAMKKAFSKEALPVPIAGIIQALFNDDSKEEVKESKVSVCIVLYI